MHLLAEPGWFMEDQWPEQSPISPAFGRRRVRPCVCVIDRKQHIRTFLCDALEELGFITRECAHFGELDTVFDPQRSDLVVLGLSRSGEEAAKILDALSAKEFGGKVLLLGPRASRMLAAVQEFGEQLGLAMLPFLVTPFGTANFRDSVAALVPTEMPSPAPVDVAEAMSAGWLELWYQPKIETRTVAVNGAEALIRMRHPTWGIVTPAYFIPDEGDQQFRALSEFVIDRAVQDWHYFVTQRGPIEIAINLPMAFFLQPEAIRDLCGRMPNHPAFEGMMIEINGVEIIRSLPLAKSVARQLRFHNIGISIDDLGTEWPSLMDLPDFPFVELKVGCEFITGCADYPLKKTVCGRILELADSYGVRTVAEGVETTADFLAVREMGFDLAQGFLFAKPMNAKKFARAVLSRQMVS
jgi:EAL domain-containing protein (putative c-di-GMP-specific phosphodiesterase class I)